MTCKKLLILFFFSLNLFSEVQEARGKIAVYFNAESKDNKWLAKTFEWNVHKNLNEINNVEIVDSSQIKFSQCDQKINKCLDQILLKNKIDAIMLGSVSKESVDFKVYDTKRRSVTRSGSLDISKSSSLISMRIKVFQAFKPYLEKGGYFDQKLFKKEMKQEINEIEFSKLIMFLVCLFLLALIPRLYLTISKHFKQSPFYKSINISSYAFPFIHLCFSVIGLIILKFSNNYNLFHNGLIYLMGGIAWGYILLLHIRFIFPALSGLERANEKVLYTYLKSWLVVSVFKFVIFLFIYLPIGFLLFKLSESIGFSLDFGLIVFIPFSLLFLWTLVNLVLECSAMDIDLRFSSLDQDINEAWSHAIKKYFIGYLKRSSLSFNRELIDNVKFIVGPKKIEGCFAYGSQLFNPRIVVSEDIVIAALGADPHRKYDSLSPLLKDSFLGVMKASSKKEVEKVSFKNRLRKSFLIDIRKRIFNKYTEDSLKDLNSYYHFDKTERDNELLGAIYPKFENFKDKSVSLISDDSEDLAIVEELMAEHRKDLDKPSEILEIDDTNPRDRDFLYGILMREFGSIIRSDHILNTFNMSYLSLSKKIDLERVDQYLSLPTVKKHFHRIADGFTTFHNGFEHLFQYYYFKLFKKKRVLTRRGSAGQLNSSVVDILDQFCSFEDENPVHQKSNLSMRMRWLSNFTHKPLKLDSEENFNKKFFKFMFALFFVLFLVRVTKATLYHEEYKEILIKEEKEIKKIKKKIEKENKLREKYGR